MANSWQQPVDAEPGGGQWHKIENPGTGWLASKTASWTADRFTTASGGMAVDFSSVVPAGTNAVLITVYQVGVQSAIHYRAAGDTEISNTPNASSEVSHWVMGSDDDVARVQAQLSTGYKAEFSVNQADTDLYISYPSEYML